jgi:hypothetical protein
MAVKPAIGRESTDEGVVMKKKRRAITVRLGPLGLSLLAAGITAVGLAAVSLADSGGDSSGSRDNGPVTIQAPAPGGAGEKVFGIQGPNLSAEDKQKMEEFQQCMEDNGAPKPPDPGDFDPSQGPPKPPSEAEQKQLQQAWEACRDKLPEDLQKAGPPQISTCGPPPGAPAPGSERGQQQNQDQSDPSSGNSSGGSSA